MLKAIIKSLLTKIKLMPLVVKEDELDEYEIDWNGRLSGGKKQKIAIVRAILSNSKVIIMDEGTSAFDSLNKDIVHDLLNSYRNATPGFIGIFTSHDDNDNLADMNLVITGDTIVCHDTV